MDAPNIIKSTMLIGLGIVSANSTQAVRYFIPSNIECNTPLSMSMSATSTRFNNSERFSLEQLKLNKRKLETIKNLRANWNNYEGEAFDESVITRIEKIISDLDYQPQIYPTGRGSIQIEKYIDEDNLVEIEISKEEIFAYQVKGGKEVEREISVYEINNFIADLYA